MRKLCLILLLVALLAMPLGLHAQRAEQALTDPAFIWTAGQLDPADNSVYYSLFVASGEEIINGLTITGLLPQGATFVADFWKPDSAAFVGASGGTVIWTMDTLGANSIAGPFTFQVTFENADAEDFAPPGAIAGSLIWDGGQLGAASLAEDVLSPVEDTGTVTLEPGGTLDLVPVGETGAWLLVPEGAVSEAVTLTISRLSVDEETALPEVDFDTWWCGQYSITADKDVTLNQPLTLILPIRRALTPGEGIAVFGKPEGGEWSVLSDGVVETTDGETADAIVVRDGLSVRLILNSATLGSTSSIVAVGVSTAKRSVSISTGTQVAEKSAEYF